MGGASCNESTCLSMSGHLRRAGYNVLIPGFYLWKGLSRDLARIPVEYAERAVHWLKGAQGIGEGRHNGRVNMNRERRFFQMDRKPTRILMLYGVNCTRQIWNRLIPYLGDYEMDVVEYPHSLTKAATTVDALTKWVYESYHSNPYDAVIGHSLGGMIALQLAAEYGMKFHAIVYLDTNLKPANAFYRNVMLPEHMRLYGQEVLRMFKEEKPFYHEELLKTLQEAFDYTAYLRKIPQKVYALYGDRGMPEYPKKIEDLNLNRDALDRLEIKFVPNSCHMMMIENPKQLADILKDILELVREVHLC